MCYNYTINLTGVLCAKIKPLYAGRPEVSGLALASQLLQRDVLSHYERGRHPGFIPLVHPDTRSNRPVLRASGLERKSGTGDLHRILHLV